MEHIWSIEVKLGSQELILEVEELLNPCMINDTLSQGYSALGSALTDMATTRGGSLHKRYRSALSNAIMSSSDEIGRRSISENLSTASKTIIIMCKNSRF